MIVSYRDKRSSNFSGAGKRVSGFAGIERQARRKLDRLEAAAILKDLAVLARNRFEVLSGDRNGLYGIRIKAQRQICFECLDRLTGPSNVEIVHHY